MFDDLWSYKIHNFIHQQVVHSEWIFSLVATDWLIICHNDRTELQSAFRLICDAVRKSESCERSPRQFLRADNQRNAQHELCAYELLSLVISFCLLGFFFFFDKSWPPAQLTFASLNVDFFSGGFKSSGAAFGEN